MLWIAAAACVVRLWLFLPGLLSRKSLPLSGHSLKKNNARAKTQRHVKNLPELEKPRTPDLKSIFSLNIIIKEATYSIDAHKRPVKCSNNEDRWFTMYHVKDNKVWESKRILNISSENVVANCRDHTRHTFLMIPKLAEQWHDGTIRYRLVILAQCGNSRRQEEGLRGKGGFEVLKFTLYKNGRKK